MEFIDLVRTPASAVTYPASGDRTTRIGYRAGTGSTGPRNVFVGYRAGDMVSVGGDNIAIGCDAMRAGAADSSRNVVVGARSTAQTGRSVVIGADIDAIADNVVCIGHDSVVTRANTVVLGGGSHTSFDICSELVTGDRAQGLVRVAGAVDCAAVRCPKITLDSHWDMRVGGNKDLVLVSKNKSAVFFNDTFSPGVLNFTGQHHCVAVDPATLRPGLVVVATGRFCNLDGGPVPTCDEAVPVVELCARRADPRVFGVVSRVLEGDDLRMAVGHIGFELPGAGARRVVVNSVGEGGVWVCDSDGPVLNGDLLVSSGAAPGYCCRQGDDIVRSCTVCKATCDATFDGPGATEELPGGLRARFIGCVFLL